MHSLCFIYTFDETIPQKGAYPLHISILNYCIYACLININQLLGIQSLLFLNNSELLKYLILDNTLTPSN